MSIVWSTHPRRLLLCLLPGVLALSPYLAWAQSFKAGDVIEYKVRGAWPEKWERGSYIRELPGGKQVLIHEKPSEFFPEGPEIAFEPAEIRRVGASPAPNALIPAPRGPASAPVPAGTGTPVSALGLAQAGLPRSCPAGGLMSKDEAISFSRATIGGDPWKNPPRDANLALIRDCIKTRGASFTADADFGARMDAQGSNSSHIGWAVNGNRGPHPALKDYFATWTLRAANRGSHSAGTDSAGRATITTTDSQVDNSGQLTINADGTYLWKMGRRDVEAQWLRGSWREVKPAEGNSYEGGPAIWLMKAKQGYDYMVRMGRDPAWPGWIDVGMGVGRTPIEYGRKP